jgi:hypothetical protein
MISGGDGKAALACEYPALFSDALTILGDILTDALTLPEKAP